MVDDTKPHGGAKSYRPIEDPPDEEEPTHDIHMDLPDPDEESSVGPEVRRALEEALAKARSLRDQAELGQTVEDSSAAGEKDTVGDVDP